MTSYLPTQIQNVFSSIEGKVDDDSSKDKTVDGDAHRNARVSSVHPQAGLHSEDLDAFLENQVDTTEEGRARLEKMFPETTQFGWLVRRPFRSGFRAWELRMMLTDRLFWSMDRWIMQGWVHRLGC
jgi:hypothetical protein